MRVPTTLALLALLGCVRLSRPVPIDPGVNFAAHVQRDEIVLDRVPGGHGGRVDVPGWFHWGEPSFVVTANGQTVADLALTAPATVQVRTRGGVDAPVLAAVEPSWEDNAIRLTLHSSRDAVLRSDVFE